MSVRPDVFREEEGEEHSPPASNNSLSPGTPADSYVATYQSLVNP